jgi:hypothetical protein
VADYQDRLKLLAGISQLHDPGLSGEAPHPLRPARLRLQADPPVLHGPYWQFSRADRGRTVTRWITEEQAAPYKKSIANRRTALGILAASQEASRQAESAPQAPEGRESKVAIRSPAATIERRCPTGGTCRHGSGPPRPPAPLPPPRIHRPLTQTVVGCQGHEVQ